MSNYRRVVLNGGTFFFTVVTYQRSPIFENVAMINKWKCAVKTVLAKYPVTIDAWVLLPDPMHFIWTLPGNDNDYSKRIGLIKSTFSKSLSPQHTASQIRTASRTKQRESTIWQRRFWEHQIRDEHDYRNHIDYVHVNPLKHQCVNRVKDWPHSTFHRYVRQGIYPPNWCGDITMVTSKFGE